MTTGDAGGIPHDRALGRSCHVADLLRQAVAEHDRVRFCRPPVERVTIDQAARRS